MSNWYCIEYFSDYPDLHIYKTQSTKVEEAIYELYRYTHSENPVVKKCIDAQDSVEAMIEVFERMSGHDIHIVNIYTLGNWVYCTETMEKN